MQYGLVVPDVKAVANVGLATHRTKPGRAAPHLTSHPHSCPRSPGVRTGQAGLAGEISPTEGVTRGAACAIRHDA
jgi:hypothetical protein